MKLLGVGFSTACLLGTSHAIKSNSQEEAWWNDQAGDDAAIAWWGDESASTTDDANKASGDVDETASIEAEIGNSLSFDSQNALLDASSFVPTPTETAF